MNTINEKIKIKAKNALTGLFVADALAMPVHWYYRISDIYQAFPNGVQQFEPAPATHPGAIMSLHSKQQGGRKHLSSKDEVNIVGDVILKGRQQFWDKANIHYHHGMQAGDNTLNSYCAKLLLQSILENHADYDREDYLARYIAMMTAQTPPHKDTYAESYHRGFFANYNKGKDITACGAITHDTASIGGLVSIGPLAIVLFLAGYDLIHVQSQCENHLVTTHPDDDLLKICCDYVELIYHLLFNLSNLDSHERLLNIFNNLNKSRFNARNISTIEDASIVGGRFSSACYITDAWPSVLFLACKYHDKPIVGLLANTNLGGDNVHRGAVLATLLGLCQGQENPQLAQLFAQLTDHQDLDRIINTLLNQVE